jgi:ferredoxin
MYREVFLSLPRQLDYSRVMPGFLTKAAIIALALVAATSADAQTRRHRAPREAESPAPAAPTAPTDKRDRVVQMPGAFNGKPYWLVLAQCGGTYFKLNTFYADAAAHARVIKPDPKATAEYTRDLKDAIKTATIYFDATERFLMTDRGIERVDAVITYDPQSRSAGDRLKTIEAAQAAAQACPTLYKACQGAFPKACSEALPPTS